MLQNLKICENNKSLMLMS